MGPATTVKERVITVTMGHKLSGEPIHNLPLSFCQKKVHRRITTQHQVRVIPQLGRRTVTHQLRVIPQLGWRTVTHQLRVIPQLGRRTAMHQLRVQTQLSRITVIPHRSRTITTLRVIPPFVTKMRTHQLLWWLTKTYFPSH
jgi:hypothetical protein